MHGEDRKRAAVRLAVLALIVWLALPSPASAAGSGAYTARQFDVRATVLDSGALDVAETLTFDFQSGTFEKVWREIPRSRTDGLEILEARMDGTPVTPGEGPGHIIVSNLDGKTRVEWRFAPIGRSAHTFELHYVARGVAYRDGDRDVVRWRILPAEHPYKIGASRATIVAPATPTASPVTETRRTGTIAATQSGNTVEIVATGIDKNGWMTAEIHYPSGSLVTTLPAWQQRDLGARALAPRWAAAAGGLFIAGLLALFVIRQNYAASSFDVTDQTTTTQPPDALPAALAAALASKGRLSGIESVSTLLDLADRGVLTVRELPRRFGVRNYELSQVAGKHDLAEHEVEALSIAFDGSGDDVTMAKARGRLGRNGRRFRIALNGDLAERGLLDPSRKAVRDRLTVLSIGMLFAALISAVGLAALIPRFEGWPLLPALALGLCGIIGVALAATTSPLSDEGLMQGAQWRGFKRHLKALAAARDDMGAAAVGARWIVYGIALGLAYQWARYLKKHPSAAPSWFVSATNEDAGGAFAAFIGSSAVRASPGGHGGAAAGGGSSGAG